MLESIEIEQNLRLPKTYKDWFYGGGPGKQKFAGTDMDFPNLANLREWAKELLVESGIKFKLPNNAYVFAMHQGYQFMYFLCGDDDDPEVWYFHEGNKEPQIKWTSFSEFANDT